MLSVYLQQECKPKPKAMSASSWYRCSNLAHSKDTPLRLPLPSITFFYLPYYCHFIGSPKTCSFHHTDKIQEMIYRTDQTWQHGGGGCFSFCTQQGAGQRNSCAGIILYCKDLYHTDLSPLMSPLYFSPAKNILNQYLTFMGPCIANIFQYISNKIQLYTLYLYLETAITPLLLSAAIVEELELRTVCCRYNSMRS